MGWMTDTDTKSLIDQLKQEKPAAPGGAAVSQDEGGNWSLQEHGNTRALQGPEVDDAKKYVADLAAQQAPAPAMEPDTQLLNEQQPNWRNSLGAGAAAVGPAMGLPTQRPRGAMESLFLPAPLDPRSAKQNLRNLGGVLNPGNLIHPKRGLVALGKLFGR